MDKTNELAQLKKQILDAGLKNSNGKLSARERISCLFDSGSFIETDMFSGRENDAASEGVITGYGTIDSRAVFVYAQDGAADGGFGREQAKKIMKVVEMAKTAGAPIVALIDSVGVKLDDGADALAAMGELYSAYALLSGRILKLTAVFGTCSGGAALISGLSDFSFMTKDSRLMLSSDAICAHEGRAKTDISGARVNSSVNGNVDFVAEDEKEAINQIKMIISLLPGNKFEHAPELVCTDDLNRLLSAAALLTEQPESLIAELVDNGEFFEVAKGYSDSVASGLARINGRTVAVVSGNGELDLAGMKKAARLINFANAFSLPVLTLCNVFGFKASKSEEEGGILKASSELAKAYAVAVVPKVTVITGASCTSAGMTFGSRAVGADFVISWPEAVIGTLSPDMAGVLLYGKDGLTDKEQIKASYKECEANAISAARSGYIDDVVEPETTRQRIAAAFEMLYGKTINARS